jgi:NAD-dependent deacetylase
MSGIVILTGAGISAESGIKTFRDQNGLWENHRVEDVASPEGFARNPALVQEFYNARRAQLLSPEVQPNPAHHALAELERSWNGEFLLVTQNVDDLHERAGSRRLVHMHGELLKARCEGSGQIFAWREALSGSTSCPCCDKKGRLRPHIVWFGELPLELERIYGALEECELFIAIGTSGQVYPAAGFVSQVPADARRIELNAEASAMSQAFHERILGQAGVEVPKLVEKLLRPGGNPP